MERSVEIPVSKNLRNKIKAKKRELTYEQFLNNLLKKLPEERDVPLAHTKKTNSQPKRRYS